MSRDALASVSSEQPRREPSAFYPDEEPRTRGERTFEQLRAGEAPLERLSVVAVGPAGPFLAAA